MTASAFTVTVSLDDQTRRALSTSWLYALKAVKSTAAGEPLVWYRAKLSIAKLTFQWQPSHEVFAAEPTLNVGEVIQPGVTSAIETGMTWDAATNETKRTNEAAVINLQTSGDAFTAGLAQPVGASGSPALPYCAFLLYPTLQIALEPVDQVVLTFSTGSYEPATVLPRESTTNDSSGVTSESIMPGRPDTSTQSVLIDMTGAKDNTRAVTYSVMNGWSCKNEVWATIIAASEPVGAYAIQTS